MDKDDEVCVCVCVSTHSHTMEQYSAIKMNEIMPFVAMWIDMGENGLSLGLAAAILYTEWINKVLLLSNTADYIQSCNKP